MFLITQNQFVLVIFPSSLFTLPRLTILNKSMMRNLKIVVKTTTLLGMDSLNKPKFTKPKT